MCIRDRRGASVLVGGMCETDYSGYPDCRDNTLKAMQVALSLGLARPMTVETPLMFLDKAQTWALAETLGGAALVALVEAHTHTCYLGQRGPRFAWGHGCGQCPACELRARGRAHQGQGGGDVARAHARHCPKSPPQRAAALHNGSPWMPASCCSASRC